MAIRDISVTSVQSSNTDWTTLLQVGKGGLGNDPQSGGILKVLVDNGFAEKIKNGAITGHTYMVWHTPPSVEFVLVDSWVDQEGATKKHYEFFKISEDTSSGVELDHLSSLQENDPVTEHPILIALKEIDHEIDELLKLSAHLA